MIITNTSSSNITFVSTTFKTYEVLPNGGTLVVGNGEIPDSQISSLVARGSITVTGWPQGSAVSDVPYTITQYSITLPPGVPVNIVSANASRKYLSFMVVGANDVTVAPGLISGTPVVSGIGLIYQAQAAGKQGGSQEFPNGAPTNSFQAISSLGSQIIIWDGI